MSKPKTQNPYRKGTAYSAVFADLARGGKNGVTRQSLLKRHAPADVTVVLSPRAEGASRGDCRGNLSAQGHKYYVSKSEGKDGQTRFVLHARKKELPRATRKKTTVAAKKVATKGKAKAKAKAKAKSEAKA
jgi:hypothetical protein